jgi:hypothetical protein
VLYHINIAQITTTTKDLSDETDAEQRYTIREILFCSSEFIVLYSEGRSKKKIRVFKIKDGKLHRWANIELLSGEGSSTTLLDGGDPPSLYLYKKDGI